jgi:hypothetical protein
MTLIERLARARCEAKGYAPEQEVRFEGAGTRKRFEWIAEHVRADIEAMREPPPEVTDPEAWSKAIHDILSATTLGASP